MTKEPKPFPKAPDWKKVQKMADILVDSIDEAKLTYTEKFQVLDIVQRLYNREYYNNSVITFLEAMHGEAEKEFTTKAKNIYG